MQMFYTTVPWSNRGREEKKKAKGLIQPMFKICMSMYQTEGMFSSSYFMSILCILRFSDTNGDRHLEKAEMVIFLEKVSQ